MKKNSYKKKFHSANNSKELAEILGLSESDRLLMEYKAQLSKMAVQAIIESELSVNEIVERSGVARSKVSAIKNGSLASISSDLFLKVISGCGCKVSMKLTA